MGKKIVVFGEKQAFKKNSCIWGESSRLRRNLKRQVTFSVKGTREKRHCKTALVGVYIGKPFSVDRQADSICQNLKYADFLSQQFHS